MNKSTSLPKELTSLVNQALEMLGRAIQSQYGKSIYRDVESIRTQFKKVRSKNHSTRLLMHRKVSRLLKKRRPEDKLKIAHSFSVALELINACENAFRSHRLAQRGQTPLKTQNQSMIFVLTAHPTESRSRQCVEILTQITEKIFDHLQKSQSKDSLEEEIFHYIHLFLKIPLSKTKIPTVADEAEYIYSILFQKDSLQTQIKRSQIGSPLYVRSWVGGDKDGHPGVNDKVMLRSLSQSRRHILLAISDRVQRSKKILQLLLESHPNLTPTLVALTQFQSSLKPLNRVSPGDSQRLETTVKKLKAVSLRYRKSTGVDCPYLSEIEHLFYLFPGLTVPLELREDSQVIAQANETPHLAIAAMLRALKSISGGRSPERYVRGFVISMCESVEDYQAAIRLCKTHLGELSIPIVPLYETRKALKESTQLTQEILEIKGLHSTIQKKWGSKLEIMLGYSDSAKESGAFSSRGMILTTLHRLDRLIQKHHLTPVFFHGSGGSVARGGGSLEEQLSWWPKSAKQRFKATVQGEMVYRSFSSPQILNRQLDQIHSHSRRSRPMSIKENSPLFEFIERTRSHYSQKVADPSFLELVEKATPYRYLDQLKIGSRPSKRKKEFNLKNLRAIPWVLCWTQTRALFPVWWGVGSAWEELSQKKQAELKKDYLKSDFFSSFVNTLSYSIAKVDLSVWSFYLENSGLPKERVEKTQKEFQMELDKTQRFLKELTRGKDLMWSRPWLPESVQLRSTLIYPLNLLEIDALQREDIPLLRECVSGIASGMQTTG